MYLKPTEVKYLEEYKLLLKYNNKEERIFNMKKYINENRFKKLKDLNIFKKIKISFDTIEWKNGTDIDPEILYKESKLVE